MIGDDERKANIAKLIAQQKQTNKTMKAEDVLVKRISKDAPGAFYTYLPQRIITMAQAKDAMESYASQVADEQSIEFARWGNKQTMIGALSDSEIQELLARFKQEKQIRHRNP